MRTHAPAGINDQGFVANEVETEQIVDAGIDWSTGQPVWSSVVQVGGVRGCGLVGYWR